MTSASVCMQWIHAHASAYGAFLAEFQTFSAFLARQWIHVFASVLPNFTHFLREVDSGIKSPYSALCLVQQWIHALRQPTELLKKPTHRLREGGLGNFTHFLRVRELGS